MTKFTCFPPKRDRQWVGDGDDDDEMVVDVEIIGNETEMAGFAGLRRPSPRVKFKSSGETENSETSTSSNETFYFQPFFDPKSLRGFD
jgi:hypothetical protein